MMSEIDNLLLMNDEHGDVVLALRADGKNLNSKGASVDGARRGQRRTWIIVTPSCRRRLPTAARSTGAACLPTRYLSTCVLRRERRVVASVTPPRERRVF